MSTRTRARRRGRPVDTDGPLRRVEVANEAELERLVTKQIGAIEEGMVCLTHQLSAGGKWADVVAADRAGALVVIEIKISEDDEMLLQALEYYDYVMANRDRLAREFSSKARIDPDEPPSVVLLAPSFSERLKKSVRHLQVEVRLFEYHVLLTTGGRKGLYCTEASYDPGGRYAAPVSTDQVLAHLGDPKLQRLCQKVLKEIESEFDPSLESRTVGNREIRLKAANRIVAAIQARRGYFYVYWPAGKRWPYVEVETQSDWSNGRARAFRGIRRAFDKITQDSTPAPSDERP